MRLKLNIIQTRVHTSVMSWMDEIFAGLLTNQKHGRGVTLAPSGGCGWHGGSGWLGYL